MASEREKKSYFYVFQERKDCSKPEEGVSDLEGKLVRAFQDFGAAHPDDSEVRFLIPGEADFEKARSLFGIHQTPAFVIADEPEKLLKAANPFISFNRPAIMRAVTGNGIIYNLITDLHYLLIDKNILRVHRELTEARIFNILQKVWTEIKDLVSISV